MLAWTALLPRAGGQFIGPVPTIPNESAKPSVDTDLLQSLLHAPYPKLLLRADDTVAVKLYGVKDFDLVRRIGADGLISLPLIGGVPAAGFSPDELEKAIVRRLIDQGMVKDPQVIVSGVTQPSVVVTVSGDAAHPGVFPALGQFTLIDYLSQAGGFYKPSVGQANASAVVTLIRPSLSAPVTVPLGADPKASPYARLPVFAGDEIRVGSTGFVYTVGAFRTQGAFPLKPFSPTTVTELVALAGGIGFEGESGSAHIVRNAGNGRVVLAIDLQKILRGQVGDVALQADDILFLPTNQMKAALKGGGAGLIVGIATAAIYAR